MIHVPTFNKGGRRMMTEVGVKTRTCIDCGEPLVPGAEWPDTYQHGAIYRHVTCDRARALEDNAFRGRAAVRLFGPGVGAKPHQRKWNALPSETKKAELTRQRIIESDTSGYTPDERKAWNAKRKTIDGKRVYVDTTPKEPKPYVPHPSGPVQQTKLTTTTYRPGQAAFRKAVLYRDKRCVITGTPVTEYIWSKGYKKALCHAAHIRPVTMCNDTEYWDINNGLTMRVDVHHQFDAGLITIGENGQIMPSRWVPAEYFAPFITDTSILTDEMQAYLAGHRAWSMRNWTRWSL